MRQNKMIQSSIIMQRINDVVHPTTRILLDADAEDGRQTDNGDGIHHHELKRRQRLALMMDNNGEHFSLSPTSTAAEKQQQGGIIRCSDNNPTILSRNFSFNPTTPAAAAAENDGKAGKKENRSQLDDGRNLTTTTTTNNPSSKPILRTRRPRRPFYRCRQSSSSLLRPNQSIVLTTTTTRFSPLFFIITLFCSLSPFLSSSSNTLLCNAQIVSLSPSSSSTTTNNDHQSSSSYPNQSIPDGQNSRVKRQDGIDDQGINPGGSLPFDNSNPTVGPEWSAPYLGQGTSTTPYSLYAFGPDFNDVSLSDAAQNNQGELLDFSVIQGLGQGFPYYGGVYNYTWVTSHGFIAFNSYVTNSVNYDLYDDVNWPEKTDPSMIAPYLCVQQVNSDVQPRYPREPPPGVYYRVVARNTNGINEKRFGNTAEYNRYAYIQNNQQQGTSAGGQQGGTFLDTVTRHLREGIVGAYAFEAEVALVVTWHLTLPQNQAEVNPFDYDKASTYQMIWTTDAKGTVSYVMFNYHKLGFASNDVNGNSKLGRCKALFNGGNHTGQVDVLPGPEVKDNPMQLADLSAVPPKYRGRYLFRVDDVVLRGGCSNKTEGTVPILITPNVVGMVGKTMVDVNGMCWVDQTKSMTLFIEGQKSEEGKCQRINAAISRCPLPAMRGWGTKNVYQQPTHTTSQSDRAYVGYLYVAPPGQDPWRLEIGSIPMWFDTPFDYNSPAIQLSWYPLNYTKDMSERLRENYNLRNQDIDFFSYQGIRDNVAERLDLLVWGYRERPDPESKIWTPEHRLLGILKKDINNRNLGEDFRTINRLRKEPIFDNLNNMEWCLSPEERRRLIYDYRVGYLQLTPVIDTVAGASGACDTAVIGRRYGQVSDPISLQWLWPLNYQEGITGLPAPFNPQTDSSGKTEEEVNRISRDMCMDWYNQDGMAAQYFIKITETNSSCPCRVEYAKADLGRFMPHPRCSKQFRSVGCTITLGSSECYMSATNAKIIDYWTLEQIQGESKSSKHGQVCCYDQNGYLMHTNYQSVVETDPKNFPYNPGFPTRAYEFGTPPYTGMYNVPTFSTMHHDILPYFLCCRFSRDRCQLFYWRRPSSGCQEYKEPVEGQIIGAGHFTTMTKRVFTFNGNGVYRLISVPQNNGKPPIEIQVRMEPFPDRTVRYSQVNQKDLVQPSNASVVTGIAIGGGDIDQVQVTVRKDTRRFKYRSNIVVGGKLRYFDHMWLQRFRGVLVYVNSVRQGKQSEIYVVLQDAQIGLRIRESFAEDFNVPDKYPESYGLLDVTISSGDENVLRTVKQQDFSQQLRFQGRNADKWKEVSGIMADPQDFQSNPELTFNQDEPRQIQHQTLVNMPPKYIVEQYRSSAPNQQQTFGNQGGGINYFTTTQDEDAKKWPAYGLYSRRAYDMAPEYKTFSPAQTFQTLIQNVLTNCDGQVPFAFSQQQAQFARRGYCKVTKNRLMSTCSADAQLCRYDMSALYEPEIAKKVEILSMEFEADLATIQQHFNSCGAMNIEYPEFLLVQTPQAPKYLDTNTIKYSCYQDNWIKGTTDYVCRQEINTYDGSFVNRWNQGWQPWCRNRAQTRTFKALAGISGTILIILLIGAVFFCCWCSKKRRKEEAYKNGTIRRAPPPPNRDFNHTTSTNMAPPIGQKIALDDISATYNRDNNNGRVSVNIPRPRNDVQFETVSKAYLSKVSEAFASSSPRSSSLTSPRRVPFVSYDLNATPASNGFPVMMPSNQSRGSSINGTLPPAYAQDSPTSRKSNTSAMLGMNTAV